MSGFKDILLFVFIFILPWQLNHYFFATSSYIAGIRIDHLAYTLYLTDLIWLLLVASYWRSSIKPFIKKAGLPILLSSIWVSWMIAFSVFPLWTLYSYVRLLQVIFTGVLFSHIKREEVQLITWGFFLTTGVQLSLVLLQAMKKESIQGIWYFLGERAISLSMPGIAKLTIDGVEFLRPYGTFSHPNAMAGFFVVVALFFLPHSAKTPKSSMQLGILIMGAIITIFSASQLAIGALLIAFLLHGVQNRSFLTAGLSICTGLMLTAITLLTKDDPLSITGRLEGISYALGIIKQHPFWGVGLGNHLRTLSALPTQGATLQLQPVHNVFLYALTELGGVSLVIGGLWGKHILSIVGTILRENLPLFLAVCITMLGDHYWITAYQDRLLMGVIAGLLWRRLREKPKQTLA